MNQRSRRLDPALVSAVLITISTAACSDPLKRVDLLSEPRVLAARAEVDGEPERVSPAPGEMASVRWLVAGREPEPLLGWAFVVCSAAPPSGALPACAEPPFATAVASLPVAGEPRIEFTVPDDVGGRALAVFGAICPDSEPVVGELDLGCAGSGGTRVSLDFELALDERANRNPVLDPDAVRFDGATWAAGTDCADLPSVAPKSSHVLGLRLAESDRDPVDPEISRGPERETLQVSHFTTYGQLERAFTVLDPSATDLDVSVRFTAPSSAPADGLVRLFFVVRDLRGGADWIERAVCVSP